MPPVAILDPGSLNFEHVVADRDAIMRVNAQRHEFQLLDSILLCDRETLTFAGYHDLTPDDWWARGHIPGRPLFPGVLMLEVAAQLCSFAFATVHPNAGFVGFLSADGVKFRGMVAPPARFIVVGRAAEMRPRRMICDTQGFVNGSMVFEARIVGMTMGSASG